MRNRSQKTAETLLLDPKPTKNKEKPASHQAKLKKKVFGTRSRWNRSRKNAETSLLEPIRKRKK